MSEKNAEKSSAKSTIRKKKTKQTKPNISKLKQAENKKRFLGALKQTNGIVSQAIKIFAIDRQTHYNWIKKDPEYAQAVDDLRESFIDMAESALLNKIDEGDTASILFTLKTIGKRRGWVERESHVEVSTEDTVIKIGFGDE